MPAGGTGNNLFCKCCGHDDLKFQTGFCVQDYLSRFDSFITARTIPVSAVGQPITFPPITNSNLLLSDSASCVISYVLINVDENGYSPHIHRTYTAQWSNGQRRMLDRFNKFTNKYPEFWDQFKFFTFAAIESGRKRFSARAVFQRMRWETQIDGGGGPLKVNNHWCAWALQP